MQNCKKKYFEHELTPLSRVLLGS